MADSRGCWAYCLGAAKPRKGVKGPSVPCGVSFPPFFPLVERKVAVGGPASLGGVCRGHYLWAEADWTRRQTGRNRRERQRVAVRCGISSKKRSLLGEVLRPFCPCNAPLRKSKRQLVAQSGVLWYAVGRKEGMRYDTVRKTAESSPRCRALSGAAGRAAGRYPSGRQQVGDGGG